MADLKFSDRIRRFFDRSGEKPFPFPEEFKDWERGERNKFVGEAGEQLAVKFLRREGLRVLYRNYRAPKGGEVDIVCKHRGGLVFVEVKTRTRTDYATPGSAVDLEKQKLITKGALSWLRELDNPDVIFRFDIVEVILKDGEVPSFNRIEDAFQMPGGFRY